LAERLFVRLFFESTFAVVLVDDFGEMALDVFMLGDSVTTPWAAGRLDRSCPRLFS
jgi:hypothetical protein